MSQKRSSLNVWLVLGLFGGMLVCLCTIATIGGAAMLLLRSTPTPTAAVIMPTESPPIEIRDMEMLRELCLLYTSPSPRDRS